VIEVNEKRKWPIFAVMIQYPKVEVVNNT